MPYFRNRSGEQLWYEDQGTGCPVVLVHGWCMSSAVWRLQFEALSAACPLSLRLVAPDLRGHGRSREITGDLDFATFATDLADLCAVLELTHAVLVGWSMGAQVVLQACNELAERLAGIVLVSATPCFTATAGFPAGLAKSEASGMRLKVDRNLPRALGGFYARMFAEGELDYHPDADRLHAVLAALIPPQTAAARAALDALANADMRPLLPGIQLPTLIMNGEHDRICLPEASRYLTAAIRGARQHLFPGCGHAPFLTHAQQFEDELSRFAWSVCGQHIC